MQYQQRRFWPAPRHRHRALPDAHEPLDRLITDFVLSFFVNGFAIFFVLTLRLLGLFAMKAGVVL